MSLTIKSKCTLSNINEAVSNHTLAAVAAIAIVMGVVSISGVMEDPERIREAVDLIQSKVHVGSVMNVDFSLEEDVE